MITTNYHVSVDIPQDAWEAYKSSWAYEQAVSSAIEGFIEAGANFYGQPEEWATFSTLAEAQRCEERLKKLAADLQARFEQEYRDEH